ncbi:peroxin 8 [Sarocladium implicatum]|nr:peroxin 8 [Sarocladium implicatum]
MPADRLLNNVLQHYQDVHDEPKTEQIIGSTVHLLTDLTNPLNLSLLTSHLLTAPALWQRPDQLRIALRIISIYNTAAVRIQQNQSRGEGSGVGCEEWTRAVVKGADERSRRWQHLLILTGVLMGMEGEDRRSLSGSLRNTLGHAVVTAANLALENHVIDGSIAAASIVLALTYAFPLLAPYHQTQVDCDKLLPVLISTLAGEEGLQHGSFLDAITRNVSAITGNAILWSERSASFLQLQHLESRPLVIGMGPLSKLAGFAIQQARDTRAVLSAHDQLHLLSKELFDAWSRTPFRAIDPAEELIRLSPETRDGTWPALWRVLRKALFGIIATLQAIVSRSLLDPNMLNERVAPEVASKSLHTLRNLCFISSRDGNKAFQAYTFSYMASLDVLSRYSPACEAFLRNARTSDPTYTTVDHLDRTMDVFYLSLAEHLPLGLSTATCDELIIKPASTYLDHEGPLSPAMVELFESAHSSILSVLSCPQHSSLTMTMAPFYIVKLLESFPRRISPRQFRVAFKTVMQIVSPPFPISQMEPHLSETLLEMLRFQAANASAVPLPPSADATAQAASMEHGEEPLSEQSALALAMVDSIPFLPLPLLEEWLTIAAETLNLITDPRLRQPVKNRFVDVLVSGELDVERAAIGVAWWGTQGGRELVANSGVSQPAVMSGALGGDETVSRL